ncbi:MAG TPA: tetratricopeptide repeat protein [Cystobacter sp.]
MPEDAQWGGIGFGKLQPGEAPGDISASFEAALQQVDGQLESFVQVEVPAEAVVPAPPPPEPVAQPVVAAPAAVPLIDEADSLAEWVDLPFDNEAPNPPAGEQRAVEPQLPAQRAMDPGARPVPSPEPAPAPSVAVSAPPVLTPTPPVSAPPVSAPAATASAQGNDEEQQLAQLIEKRYVDVQSKQDYFSLLGLAIGPDVKREQVKAAFVALAKRFHPDRLPPSLSALAPQMTSVYEAIREAYDVLYDDAKRTAYLQELRSKGSFQLTQRTSGEDPNELFKAGEIFFRKRDFAAAADHFDRAFQAEPRAVFLAARAWAIYMDPQRKAEVARTKQMMAEALKMDPRCDRAHYQLGVIARVEGDMERAERHFREAIRANPKHLEANQELRLIEMRKKNPPPPKKGGLFR